MRRPTPIQNEITFSLEEMFFSITDKKGIILDGNEVFTRLSRYSLKELIGSPHNIIRHPDMPKIVFKTLWETILGGKPICAYVKNLAKDGAFYWVFATIIPIGDHFISIRMKSTTSLKDIVEGVYKELLDVEKKSGVPESLAVLIEKLNSLGFHDYDAFVLASLTAELSSRSDVQAQLKDKSTNHHQLSSLQESFFKIFNIINKLSGHTKSISEKIIRIGAVSRAIEFSALNATIEANRLGDEGRALAVIAQHISSDAAEAKRLNSNINQLATTILELFRSSQLSAALSTLQIEMLLCFINQWSKDRSSMNEEGFKNNSIMLSSFIEDSLKVSNDIIIKLANDINMLSSELGNISQILMTLDFIQKNGSIEAARLSNGSDFSKLFSSILDLIRESKTVYSGLSELVNTTIKKEVSDANKEYQIISRQWNPNSIWIL